MRTIAAPGVRLSGGCPANGLRAALRALALFALVGWLFPLAQAQQNGVPEKVVVNVGWMAQAPLGGFYQAAADGTYRRYGLDVELNQINPDASAHDLMIQGKIDILINSDLMEVFESVHFGSPAVAVAAIFQKDPRAVMAHPGHGYKHIRDLTEAPALYISKIGQATYWKWMKAAWGFVDEMVQPEAEQDQQQQEWTQGIIIVPRMYAYNLRPFMENKNSLQMGYVVDEPIVVRAVGGFDPTVFMLADYGFNGYSTLIQARDNLLRQKPEVVRKFVQASIVGWYNYLYGDYKSAHALIKQVNPVMSDAYLEQSRALIKSRALVDSGEALTLGIGAMNRARIQSFYDLMVKAGLYHAGEIDLDKTFSTDFVNQKIGLDVKEKLTRP